MTNREDRANRFLWNEDVGMPTVNNRTQCQTCKHWHGARNPNGCDAYVKIPLDIILEKVSHRKPLPGDNGIQWEPKESGQ